MGEPFFSVEVLTYNHEQYIAQNLDSIISQEHDFPYQIVIGDDCSSDKTREIVTAYQKRYPEIITLILNETNMGLIKNYFNVMAHCKGKYIMECAGDDYWLPGKVKTQIDFMESHPDAAMCYGKIKELDQKTGRIVDERGGPKTSFEDLMDGNTIQAVTVCIRNDVFQEYLREIAPVNKPWVAEDYPMWLWFSKKSKIYFLNKTFAVYRCIQGSVSHPKAIEKRLDFQLGINKIREFFSGYFAVPFDVQKAEDKIYKAIIREAIAAFDIAMIRNIETKIKYPTIKDRLVFLAKFPQICGILFLWYKIKDAVKGIRNRKLNKI